MKINRKAFTDILGMVKCGLASKEVVENSTCFIFKGGKVLTYNDDVAVSHPLELGLEGAVKGKEFEALLNKMADEEVEIYVHPDGGLLMVEGTVKGKAKLRLEENANIDDILGMLGTPDNWTPLPETFRPSVDFCQFSVGRDPNKQLLTAVYCGMVTKDDGSEIAVTISSDDNRITICELGDGITLEPFCLPSAAVKELKAFLPVEYAFTEGWIHFRTKDNVTFSSRILMGMYPAERCRQICANVRGETVKLPNGLVESLDRAGIFSGSDGGASVNLELKDGFLTVKGEGEAGSYEESARIRYHNDPVKFDVAPDFLKSILQHTSETVIGNGLLQFSGLGFVHVMATKVK